MQTQATPSNGPYLDLRDLGVVVLDDNPNTRTMIAEVLQGLGVRKIYRAATCAEALSAMKANAIDVLFTDIELTKEDGLTFLRQVRAAPAPKLANVTAIVISSHATEARVMESGVAGADGFLSKPFNVGGFAKRLTEGLAGRRAMVRFAARKAAPQQLEV